MSEWMCRECGTINHESEGFCWKCKSHRKAMTNIEQHMYKDEP